jgi:hypothetical protein
VLSAGEDDKGKRKGDRRGIGLGRNGPGEKMGSRLAGLRGRWVAPGEERGAAGWAGRWRRPEKRGEKKKRSREGESPGREEKGFFSFLILFENY